jgi:undecaprenyl-diphosphatase
VIAEDDRCPQVNKEDELATMLDRLTLHDHRLLDALARREAPPWVDRLFRAVTHLGGATFTVAAALVLIVLPDTRHLGLVAGMANLFSHLAVQVLKRTVVRQRPTVLRPQIVALAELPDHFSFPSGHSAAAMSLAVPILLSQPLVGIPCLLLALAIGASRVYLRVHYVTDVVVGQMLGTVTAVAVYLSLS